MAGRRCGHGGHVIRAIRSAQRDGESEDDSRIRRHADPPVPHASDRNGRRPARDGWTHLRVVWGGADPGRAGLYGAQLRHFTGESRHRVEGTVSMGSASDIFWMADTFDWLRDVICERTQRRSDRDDASLYGLANRSGRNTIE